MKGEKRRERGLGREKKKEINSPRQYRTNKKASTLIPARIRYRPHEMAVMMGGVTCATMKLEIHSDAVQIALPLDCIGGNNH